MQSHVDSADDQLQALLQAVFEQYGFDFREYARQYIGRRIRRFQQTEHVPELTDLRMRLVQDRACMERFLVAMTVHVTSMFRDPPFYSALRSRVLPILRSYPFIRVWHAGCSTGEEVISMAILLEEESLYSRSRIYVTDMNEHVLDQARSGVFAASAVAEYEANYRLAGGRAKLADYYTAKYDSVIFQRELRRNMIFSRHNLVTDGPFHEFDVIFCRNVMIYFSRPLSNRVHGLLYKSLAPQGFLGLGSRESVRFTPHEASYELLESTAPIFRRKA